MNARPVVLVMGAAAMGSIGHAVALQAARAGFDVALADIDRPTAWIPELEHEADWKGLASVAAQVIAEGARALTLHCDVTRRDQIQETVRAAEAFGPIAGMVNTTRAPIVTATPILDEDDDYWALSFDVNVRGALWCAQAVARTMLARGAGGSIVHVSSVAGLHPVHGRGAYCASKAALHMVTRCLSFDLAGAGIRVNAVLPGVIATHRMDPDEREQARAQGISLAEQRRRILQAHGRLIPMGRVGQAEEVAATVGFLLSPASAYITGELISVAGGSFAPPYGAMAPVQAARAAMAN